MPVVVIFSVLQSEECQASKKRGTSHARMLLQGGAGVQKVSRSFATMDI
jgi:hypothetical protein